MADGGGSVQRGGTAQRQGGVSVRDGPRSSAADGAWETQPRATVSLEQTVQGAAGGERGQVGGGR